MLLINISHWYSHTHACTQLVCTLSDKQKNTLVPIHPSLPLKHDVCVANKWWGLNIKEKKKKKKKRSLIKCTHPWRTTPSISNQALLIAQTHDSVMTPHSSVLRSHVVIELLKKSYTIIAAMYNLHCDNWTTRLCCQKNVFNHIRSNLLYLPV